MQSFHQVSPSRFTHLITYLLAHLSIFLSVLYVWFYVTVQSAYKEPAYKELLVIRNLFSFHNLYQGTSSLYVYKELRL